MDYYTRRCLRDISKNFEKQKYYLPEKITSIFHFFSGKNVGGICCDFDFENGICSGVPGTMSRNSFLVDTLF